MLPQLKKETTESKEFISKYKEKKCGTPTKKNGEMKNAKYWKTINRLKKKKKCSTQGPRRKKEKLEKENREEVMKRKKEEEIYTTLFIV